MKPMQFRDFIDFYEVLEISPNAGAGTIERMFRHLARLYHPDNKETGDRQKFELVLQANSTLKDPVKRAQYDLERKARAEAREDSEATAEDATGIERDIEIQSNLLSILYLKRRRNVTESGIGEHELERLLNCTPEQLEFQIWYMKQKGWILRENGMLAITVEGIDRVTSVHRERSSSKLLTDQTGSVAA
jgi:curved DNA-binding protein CbpA